MRLILKPLKDLNVNAYVHLLFSLLRSVQSTAPLKGAVWGGRQVISSQVGAGLSQTPSASLSLSSKQTETLAPFKKYPASQVNLYEKNKTKISLFDTQWSKA